MNEDFHPWGIIEGSFLYDVGLDRVTNGIQQVGNQEVIAIQDSVAQFQSGIDQKAECQEVVSSDRDDLGAYCMFLALASADLQVKAGNINLSLPQ